MVKKVTFTLDDRTIQRLERSAERLDIPKSQVIRDAVEDYYERIGKLSERERLQMLSAFDELVPRIRRRTAAAVAKEIDEIRAARCGGGRRSGGDR